MPTRFHVYYIIIMDQLYVPEPAEVPERFKGGDKIELARAISAVKPGYNLRDPRTWPRIDHPVELLATNSFGVQALNPLPPRFVAYSSDDMAHMLLDPYSAMARADRKFIIRYPKKSPNRRFCFYPFNFTKSGSLRVSVGIPKAEFEYWMTALNGDNWREKVPCSTRA